MSASVEPRLVVFERTGSIARITLDRPDKLNAINHELGVQLWDAFARCQEDTSIRAIVLAGTGRAFCAGDELGRERTPDEEDSLRRRGKIKHYVSGPGRWTSTVRLMRSLSQPVVARIQGYAYGAGFNLALAADFRVMARDARLATPFIKRGLATGTNLLQQYVGVGKAIEMTLLGEPIEAEEALRLGLVNEVVEPLDLDEAAERWARRLADGPTAAMGLTKHAVYTGWSLDPDAAYWYQGSAVAEARDLEDLAEGLAAFKARRAPRFTGR
ncbi:MAG: enoyl-CoA hydratase/isomerase family protein [Chloroflexi bacterium]|nr:enoyl-CoA hydratase/isomerase family protein [Chloroflexota bacterium]MBV9597883.1 enoyl-CoA hydratase/isomerase family protein [Chloroflexota bacterium]